MFEIKELDNPLIEKKFLNRVSGGLLKFGGLVELLVILVIWVLLFRDSTRLGGFSEAEIVTYLLGGSIVSLFTGWLLGRLIAQDLRDEKSKELIDKPLKYFGHIISHGWAKVISPFAIAFGLHIGVLVFFRASFILNKNPAVMALVAGMLILSFIIEFLLAYLIRLNIFWTIESGELYKLLERLKKFLSGAYFPLSFLPSIFVSFCLFLPFSYSFYVPAELYLGKISQSTAIRGLLVQIAWILFLYLAIKIMWIRRQQKIK